MTKSNCSWFSVWLCGCTDCFIHAVFINREDAVEWANLNNHNPEGFLIKEHTTLAELDGVGEW